MRRGIVEGEPGSMPWGQWWLIMWVREHFGRRRKEQPDPDRNEQQKPPESDR